MCDNTALFVTIPAYNEPDPIAVLESLYQCQQPDGDVYVLLFFNAAENAPSGAKQINLKGYADCLAWARNHPQPNREYVILIDNDVPAKFAGVGYARRVLMDRAAGMFQRYGYDDGIILSLDADCRVSRNYLSQTCQWFRNHRKLRGCTFYFEHLAVPATGTSHEAAMQQYELFLRYYVHGIRLTGFPFGFHTVGSAFAVRVNTYLSQGGMNLRKAGEDFYFIHKITRLGNFCHLGDVTVYPSARLSDRVPFGTGKALLRLRSSGAGDFPVYPPAVFFALKQLYNLLPSIYQSPQNMPFFLKDLPASLVEYLQNVNFPEIVAECRAHSTNYENFTKRVFFRFNALKILKAIHYMRDHQFGETPVTRAAEELMKISGYSLPDDAPLTALSEQFKKLDRITFCQ